MFVGKRTHNKDFNHLLQAYSVWKNKDEIFLFVVGSKWDLYELNLIKNLKIEKTVQLFESIDDCILSFLYNQAIAFIYPSIYEGFGIPLLEAMSCGCPIVASRIPSTYEVAEEIPFYFNVGDTEDLLNALDSVLDGKDIENRKNMGLSRCKEFSWDKSAKKLFSIYKDIQ